MSKCFFIISLLFQNTPCRHQSSFGVIIGWRRNHDILFDVQMKWNRNSHENDKSNETLTFAVYPGRRNETREETWKWKRPLNAPDVTQGLSTKTGRRLGENSDSFAWSATDNLYRTARKYGWTAARFALSAEKRCMSTGPTRILHDIDVRIIQRVGALPGFCWKEIR